MLFDPRIGVVIAIAILVLPTFLYFLRKSKEESVHEETDAVSRHETRGAETGEAAASPRAVGRVSPKAEAAKPAYDSIPQDSVLRRHFLSHLRYMVETVNSPRPTDSVLRRHHDHLIESELEACLSDASAMAKLTSRFDEHRRRAAH